ncbi:SAND domain protein, partial [Necator americanus]
MSEDMKRQSFEVLAAETSTEEGTTNMYGKIIQTLKSRDSSFPPMGVGSGGWFVDDNPQHVGGGLQRNYTDKDVICGSLVAKMHIELFLCPGIHQSCIEYEGEMISPKEFTVRANKDKQKDWKGSIRIGKSNLRSLMEMHSFDFYNHSQFCSAKCQSRNYITHKEKEGDKDRRNNIQAEKATAQISQLCNSRILNSYDL